MSVFCNIFLPPSHLLQALVSSPPCANLLNPLRILRRRKTVGNLIVYPARNSSSDNTKSRRRPLRSPGPRFLSVAAMLILHRPSSYPSFPPSRPRVVEARLESPVGLLRLASRPAPVRRQPGTRRGRAVKVARLGGETRARPGRSDNAVSGLARNDRVASVMNG